nr:MAG TPA: hypothetical protein [Bacteriophage sp.]
MAPGNLITALPESDISYIPESVLNATKFYLYV